jgi:sugar/nucleoside kinase (ribokinase family)
MAKILVLGGVNVDRIWRLDGSLRPGGHNTFFGVERRVGGGGFNAGCALIALGHEVSIATSLGDDKDGRWCMAALRERGFGTDDVVVRRRPTRPTEVLVDPFGERTILASVATEVDPPANAPATSADLAYVAARRADPVILSTLLARMDVISQVPLESGQLRPAIVLIGSASDISTNGLLHVFEFGLRIAGPTLQRVVLTNGERPVRMWDRHGEVSVTVDPRPAADDTTGAGDVFAAGFIDAYLRGDTPAETVRHASAMAGLFLADRAAFFGPPRVAQHSSRLQQDQAPLQVPVRSSQPSEDVLLPRTPQ